MENNSNKITLDINLDQLLNQENNNTVKKAVEENKPSRWTQIKNKSGCHNKSLGTLAEKLLKTDLIPEKKLSYMKNDCVIKDPVILMDGRHEGARNVKRYDSLDSSKNVDIMSEAKRIIRNEKLQELYRQRQIEIIDKQLKQFKKELNHHSNVLTRNKTNYKECEDIPISWEETYWEDLSSPTKTSFKSTISQKLIPTNNRERPARNEKFITSAKILDKHNIGRVVMENILNCSEMKSYDSESDATEIKIHPLIEEVAEQITENMDAQNDQGNNNIVCSNGKENNDAQDENNMNNQPKMQDCNWVLPDMEVSKIQVNQNAENNMIINDQNIVIDSPESGALNSNKDKVKINAESRIAELKDINLLIDSVSLKPPKDLCVLSCFVEPELEIDSEQKEKQFLEKHEKKLRKKAFDKWKSYCSKKSKNVQEVKKNMEEEPNMTDKIDIFLKKINERKQLLSKFSKSTELLKTQDFELGTKKKKSSSAPLSTRYQHRFIVQQNMIAQQKARILEQERKIQQLQAKSLAVAAKQSVQQACADYLEATRPNQINATRPKMRANVCLNLEVNRIIAKENNRPEENFNPEISLSCVSRPAPAFIQAMDYRAQQRQMRHKAAQERRKQREEELRLAKEREEQAKLEEDQQAKLMRIAERRRKREEEQEKQKNLEKERCRIRCCEQLADQHYRTSLLRKYGLIPLKKLVQMKLCDMLLAKEHYRQNLLKRVFRNWYLKTQEIVEIKATKAENFDNLRLLRICFADWFQYHLEIRSNFLVAEDWYNLRMMERMVIAWNKIAKEMIIERDKKCYVAQLHYERQLKWRAIDKWRLLPSFNEIARQRERRKAKWRTKVWEILPDYKPITED